MLHVSRSNKVGKLGIQGEFLTFAFVGWVAMDQWAAKFKRLMELCQRGESNLR